jgi:hypothetical protein
MENTIQCLECGKMFKRISTTHLKFAHNMNFSDYFAKYPNCLIEHPSITDSRKQTLSNMILRYGEEEGLIRWESYCNRQAETNTFQYKNKVYGMSEEEFKQYNKSRANFGEKNGNYQKGYYKFWVEQYGQDLADKMNLECSKYKDSKSLEFHIKKYGEIEGLKRYDEFCANQSERALELILKNNGQVIYNPKSIPIIEEYAKQNGYEFQHAENGGEKQILSYYVDGYDEKNKTIFEYYEPVHMSTTKRDSHRIRRILNELGSDWKVIVYWYDGKIKIYEN